MTGDASLHPVRQHVCDNSAVVRRVDPVDQRCVGVEPCNSRVAGEQILRCDLCGDSTGIPRPSFDHVPSSSPDTVTPLIVAVHGKRLHQRDPVHQRKTYRRCVQIKKFIYYQCFSIWVHRKPTELACKPHG